MRRAEEIRITGLSTPNGKWYEVCYVWGLLDTTTVPQHFPTIKAARDHIYGFCGNANPPIPVIVQH